VCGACESELRGVVLGMGCVMADDLTQAQSQEKAKECRVRLSRADSGVMFEGAILPSASTSTSMVDEQAQKENIVFNEPPLFAVPSTPPSTILLITHSRTQSLTALPRQYIEEGAPTLFALPNTSLDKSFEEFTRTTPTTNYAQDFPALPPNSMLEKRKDTSVNESKRSNKDVEGLARSLSKNGTKKGQTGSKTATKRDSKTR
jgi:hypothetical protein